MKPCRQPYCPNKVESGFCEKHKDRERKFATTESDPWYNLKEWKGNPNKPLGQRGGMREQHLMNEPLCRHCKEEGVYNDVTGKGKAVVDHVTPFRSAKTVEKQWELFLSEDNLQTLCVPHNKTKTARDAHRSPRGESSKLEW